MGQSDALYQAAARLNAAVDALQSSLSEYFRDGNSVGALKDQLLRLTEERDRLLAELDAERNRVRRLEAAHDEVSGRLEAVMGTLRDMGPVGQGGAGLEL